MREREKRERGERRREESVRVGDRGNSYMCIYSEGGGKEVG